MKRVVSIALFGDASKKDGSGQNYHDYLPTYVLAHANLFPVSERWELHVHVDDATMASTWGTTLTRMANAELLTVRCMGSAALTKAMLWRMTPVFQEDIDFVFCRDIDCIPMPRDRAVCDVFLASGCAVHTVHDSRSHTGIMGGLCGFKNALFREQTTLRSLDELFAFAKQTEAAWAQHGTDQTALNRLVDRGNGPSLLEHRYNGWHTGPQHESGRAAGEYKCKAWSTPTPDIGRWKGADATARQTADLLANHLGAAGYDKDRAWTFWTHHGMPELARKVKECL